MSRFTPPKYSRLAILLALPRSGTYWTTRLVRPGVLDAWHDPLGPVAGDVDALGALVDRTLDAQDGRLYLADTGGMLYHRALRLRFPGARWGFVFRDRRQVAASLRRVGLPLEDHTLKILDRALHEAWSTARNPVAVRYANPFTAIDAAKVWRLATDTMPGSDWIEGMRREIHSRSTEDQVAALMEYNPA